MSSAPPTSLLQLRCYNQTTRVFWDTNYVDPSWIDNIIELIPRMKQWVATYYPGTKIGITEYNWGAESNINGATAQADILGIFGREALRSATRWTTPTANTATHQAMKNVSQLRRPEIHLRQRQRADVRRPDPDDVSAFGAVRTSDGAMTIMVVNKDLYNASPFTANITNFAAAGTAQRWQLTAMATINHLSNIGLTNGTLSDTVPLQSVTLYVLPGVTINSFNLQIGPQSSNQAALVLNGQQGLTYIFQSSPDLIHWTIFSTNMLSSNSIKILVPTTNSTQTYYRGLLTGQ